MSEILNVSIPIAFRDTYNSILELTVPPSDLDSLVGANCAALSTVEEDGTIDAKVWGQYYDWFIQEAGLRGLMIGGANGEGDNLTIANYKKLLNEAVKLKEKHGTKIIAGVFKPTRYGTEGNDGIIQQLKFLKTQESKYDYLMIELPLDESLNGIELIDFFKQISELKLKRKFIVYRTRLSITDIDIETLIKIYDNSNGQMLGVKDTMDEKDSLFLEYEKNPEAQRKFHLYQGNDHLFTKVFRMLYGLKQEHVGNISGGGNILPLTQLRQILVASIIKSNDSSLGDITKEYERLADDIQSTISNYYKQNFSPNREFISMDTRLGGRRDASIIKRIISFYYDKFPTKPLNRQLNEMPYNDALYDNLKAVIEKRNEYLERFGKLQPL